MIPVRRNVRACKEGRPAAIARNEIQIRIAIMNRVNTLAAAGIEAVA